VAGRALLVVVAAVLVGAWLVPGFGLAGGAPVPAGHVLANEGTIISEN
jgi:hypothetical protein